MVDRWGFSACKHSLPNRIIWKIKAHEDNLQLYQRQLDHMGLKPETRRVTIDEW
jgi:hypothetical protein